MIEALEQLALEAGEAIMKVYRKQDLGVRFKSDHSPVTEADLIAHQIISEGLQKLSPLACISEEGEKPQLAVNPSSYWLVDPLDGTKEFIKRQASFTVNIALIESGWPTAGVVYAPERQELYSAWQGSYRFGGRPQAVLGWPEKTTVVASQSHPETPLADFKRIYAVEDEIRVGSSIKFCLVASGRAHYYPRFSALSAWDTAAGDAIARAAGCQVLDMKTLLPLRYAFEEERVKAFCVVAPGKPFPLPLA